MDWTYKLEVSWEGGVDKESPTFKDPMLAMAHYTERSILFGGYGTDTLVICKCVQTNVIQWSVVIH